MVTASFKRTPIFFLAIVAAAAALWTAAAMTSALGLAPLPGPPLPETGTYIAFRQQYLHAKLLDPYDPRWWRGFSNEERGKIEQALNDFFADTEYDGQADAALMEALRQAGVHVSSLEDAVHAANHIVNHSKPTKQTAEAPHGNE